MFPIKQTSYKTRRGGWIDFHDHELVPTTPEARLYYTEPHNMPWLLDGCSTSLIVRLERNVLHGNYAVDVFNASTPRHFHTDLHLIKAVDCGTIVSYHDGVYDNIIGVWYRWDWNVRCWIETNQWLRESYDTPYLDQLRSLGLFAEKPYPQKGR